MNGDTDKEYFDSYDDLEVHRLMLADTPRTESYRESILKNQDFFMGKVVMDVGAGQELSNYLDFRLIFDSEALFLPSFFGMFRKSLELSETFFRKVPKNYVRIRA